MKLTIARAHIPQDAIGDLLPLLHLFEIIEVVA